MAKTYLLVEVDRDASLERPTIREPRFVGAMLDGAGLRWAVLRGPMFTWREGHDVHESPEMPTIVDAIDDVVGLGAHLTTATHTKP